MKKGFGFIAVVLITGWVLSATVSSCKSCKKSEEAVKTTDTTATTHPISNINLPHADTTLIPILSKVLDAAFEASEKKDYTKLASLLVYRGPIEARLGRDVFNAKKPDERNVVRITGEVFAEWNKDIVSKDYARVFQMDQPGGAKMTVLEVMFVSQKAINRKFFGFVELVPGSYTIVDVTSYL